MNFARATLALIAAVSVLANIAAADVIELGPRPYFLIDQMKNSPLKRKLLSCADRRFERKRFSIGHRGAPLMFPEHTVESNVAAARMGAGILECDVTFTKDGELVCRHAQCDLHTTTDIVARVASGDLREDACPHSVRRFVRLFRVFGIQQGSTAVANGELVVSVALRVCGALRQAPLQRAIAHALEQIERARPQPHGFFLGGDRLGDGQR